MDLPVSHNVSLCGNSTMVFLLCRISYYFSICSKTHSFRAMAFSSACTSDIGLFHFVFTTIIIAISVSLFFSFGRFPFHMRLCHLIIKNVCASSSSCTMHTHTVGESAWPNFICIFDRIHGTETWLTSCENHTESPLIYTYVWRACANGEYWLKF